MRSHQMQWIVVSCVWCNIAIHQQQQHTQLVMCQIQYVQNVITAHTALVYIH